MPRSSKQKKWKKIILGTVGAIVLFILVLIVNLVVFEKNASLITKGEPIEQNSEIRPALLIMDIQEATTGEWSLNEHYVHESEELIENINRISNDFKKEGLPVLFIRSEITNPLINLLNNSFAQGSDGAKFDKRLHLISSQEIVKSRNDAFFNTKLDEILRYNNTNKLCIVGLDAAHCINITVEAAQNRNYNISLIREAVLSESVEMRDSMFIEFENRGIELLSMDSVELIIRHETY